MWVLRAGKNGIYADLFMENQRIYICWNGYNEDLSKFESHDLYIKLAQEEEDNTTKVAVRNRASQLEYFCEEMKVGDLVLIPKERSAKYVLARVRGPYEYKADNLKFCHSRRIEVIHPEILGEIFPQNIKYSLGAYRNLFHVKYKEEVIKIIESKYGFVLRGEE